MTDHPLASAKILSDEEGKAMTDANDPSLVSVLDPQGITEQMERTKIRRASHPSDAVGRQDLRDDACGYQDVACWVRQLHAAGWEAIAFRRGGPVVVPMGTTWRSPSGLIYRGPYQAWKVMKDAAGERTNDV